MYLAQGAELNPLIPHPLEIGLGIHALLAFIVVVAAVVLYTRRTIGPREAIAVVLTATLLPLVGSLGVLLSWAVGPRRVARRRAA